LRLYEYEAKTLLTSAGIEVPAGSLWRPTNGHYDFPAVVKAQVLEGGRGKRGGVKFVTSQHDLMEAVSVLEQGSEQLPPAQTVLVEEQILVERELYLAFAVDRGSRSGVSILAAQSGGVEVENNSGAGRTLIPLDLWCSDLPTFVIREIARVLGECADENLATFLNSAWTLFRAHDCSLLEINPLGRTLEGHLIALDARVELDDAARFRHEEWPTRYLGTPFEIGCQGLGAVAVEMTGDIAIVTSGAGLGMATLDLVTTVGGEAACLVDLGGSVFRPDRVIRRIVDHVCDLTPGTILINAFLQLASWDALALEIVEGLKGRIADTPVVVRCVGGEAGSARRLLESVGIHVTADFEEACRAAVGRVKTPVPARSGAS